jgi:hypothetical protein
MRCRPFNHAQEAALAKFGFELSDNREIAILAGAKVELVQAAHSAHSDVLFLEISVPGADSEFSLVLKQIDVFADADAED